MFRSDSIQNASACTFWPSIFASTVIHISLTLRFRMVPRSNFFLSPTVRRVRLIQRHEACVIWPLKLTTSHFVNANWNRSALRLNRYVSMNTPISNLSSLLTRMVCLWSCMRCKSNNVSSSEIKVFPIPLP
jgi:hypothetical protein